MSGRLYGWWSDQQRELLGGYVTYADASGNECFVTQVTPDLEHRTKFDDIKLVGEVKDFVRSTVPRRSEIIEFYNPRE